MKLINFSYLFLAASLFITGCQIPNSGELEIGDAFGNETQTRGYGAKISALPTSDGTIADTDDLLINDYSESRTESIDASQLKTYFQTGLDASVLDLTDDYTWTGASDFSGSTVTLPATVSGGLTSFEAAGAAATVQSDVDTNESDADAAIALKANTADTYTQTAADAAIATSISNLLSGDPVFAGNVGFDDTPEFSAGLEATLLEFSGGSDATITRSAAGVIAVEGVDVLTTSTGYTQTAADAAFEVAGAAATVQSDVDTNESDADAAIALKANTTDTYTRAQVDTLSGLKTALADNPIYTDGNQSALIVEALARVDLDTLGFCIYLPSVTLADWSPASAVTLLDKSASNLGVKLTLETDGTVKLAMGNGSNLTTFAYSSTASVGLADGSGAQITINCDRDDDVYFYVNGRMLGAGVDCSAAVAQNLTSTANWQILTDSAGWVSGYFGVHLGERDHADIVADFYRPERMLANSRNQTALLADFETFGVIRGSVDWARHGQFNAGTTFDNDGVSDGTTSRDNVYKFTPNSASAQARFYRGSNGVPISGNEGQRYRLRYGYYIPNAASAINNLSLLLGGSGLTSGSFGGTSTIASVKGAWTDVELVGEMNVANTGQLSWFLNSASNVVGDETDDVVYFSNYTLDILGWGIVVDTSQGDILKPELAQKGRYLNSDYPHLPSTNQHLSYRGIGSVGFIDTTEFHQTVAIDWVASDAIQNATVTGQELFSLDDQIEIWARSTSGEDFVIGDESDPDRYFAEAVIGAGWSKIALANSTPDGTNYELTARPMDGSAAAESRTDRLDLRIKITRLEARK